MEKGDISNGHPPLYLVSLDVITTKDQLVEKRRWRKDKVVEVSAYDWVKVAGIFRFFMSSYASLELFDVQCSDADVQSVLEDLDAHGSNPFRYAKAYKSRSEVARGIPFRPDVQGVFDLPEHLLTYGSWGLDLTRVM